METINNLCFSYVISLIFLSSVIHGATVEFNVHYPAALLYSDPMWNVLNTINGYSYSYMDPTIPPFPVGLGNESYILNNSYLNVQRDPSKSTWTRSFSVDASSVGDFPKNVHFRVLANVTTGQIVEPYGSDSIAYLENLESSVVVHTYPVFTSLFQQVPFPSKLPGFQPLIKSFTSFSPVLQYNRTITMYIPPSLVENFIPRNVSYLVILDGDMDFVKAAGGMLLNSLVAGDIPEMILVGVPSPENFTERCNELTFSSCDTDIMANCQCDGGQTSIVFDYIQSIVLPQVYLETGFSPSEHVVAGYSLGGLSACYAAITRVCS